MTCPSHGQGPGFDTRWKYTVDLSMDVSRLVEGPISFVFSTHDLARISSNSLSNKAFTSLRVDSVENAFC